MKKLRRTLALLLVAAMAVVSVTACNNNKGNADVEGNSSTDIKISYWNSGYGSEWLEKIAKEFEEEYPQYNVILNMSSSNEGLLASYGYAEIDDTDLYLCTLPTDTKYFESLNDVMETTVKGENVTISEKFDTISKESIVDKDGNYYMLPYTGGGTFVFVYNKKMFDQYNISAPRTTGELGVVADKLLGEGISPFCHFSGEGYWKYITDVWYGQYEGYDYYYNSFYACTNEAGESPSIDVLLKKDGRYEVLKVMESIITPEYILEGSNSKNHIVAQTEFIHGKAAMMVNGNWLDTEMSEVGSMEDFGVFRVPIISAITDKLTTVKTEAALRKLITAIDSVLDGKKTAEDYRVGEDYVIDGLTVSAADWKHVNEARRMIRTGGSGNNAAMIPTYSTAKDGAKDFLRFIYSDKGVKLMAEYTQTKLPITLCEGSIDISGWTSIKQGFYNVVKDAITLNPDMARVHPIFTEGGAALFNVTFIPYFCTMNTAERMTADTAWEKQIQIVNDNYRTNWLANIK